MQSSPSKVGPMVPPLALGTTASAARPNATPTKGGHNSAAHQPPTPIDNSLSQNKTGLPSPRGQDRGPGCRDWTQEFLNKRTAKKDLRERLFVVLVKRMAQLSMARLVREETGMLSALLGRRPPPIDVKGVGGPASKPIQENTDNKCYCGRPFGFFNQHKKRCALCLDWLCDRCVMLRVPLHLVNKVDRPLAAPTDVPMLNTCEECTRIAYAYVRSVRYRAILLEGRNHPLPAVYGLIMEEDQRIAHSMFGYAKLVNDLRTIDEQERTRRTSLDYASSSSSSSMSIVHNSALSSAFQEAMDAGHEIEQVMYSMMLRIEQLGRGIPYSGPTPAPLSTTSHLPPYLQSPADSPRSWHPPPSAAAAAAAAGGPGQVSASAPTSNSTSPRSSLALPSGGSSNMFHSRSSSTSSLDAFFTARQQQHSHVITISEAGATAAASPPAADVSPDESAAQQADEASAEPMWHPRTETDIELLGNISTTLRDRLDEHRHFYDALHMQMMLLELRLLREVYVTVLQLSYELRELFNINSMERNEESMGVNVYLLLMQLLKVCKQDLKLLVSKIEDADWAHYEESIAGLVRKRLENRRLIDIPPFVLHELTPDALTVLVIAKFLGIVRVEEKKLELRTAKSRFANTKKNFRSLETIVTNTCLKQDDNERAEREKVKHVSQLNRQKHQLKQQQQHSQPPAKPAAALAEAQQQQKKQQPNARPTPPPNHVPAVGAGVLPLLLGGTGKSKVATPGPGSSSSAGSDLEDSPVGRQPTTIPFVTAPTTGKAKDSSF